MVKLSSPLLIPPNSLSVRYAHSLRDGGKFIAIANQSFIAQICYGLRNQRNCCVAWFVWSGNTCSLLGRDRRCCVDLARRGVARFHYGVGVCFQRTVSIYPRGYAFRAFIAAFVNNVDNVDNLWITRTCVWWEPWFCAEVPFCVCRG